MIAALVLSFRRRRFARLSAQLEARVADWDRALLRGDLAVATEIGAQCEVLLEKVVAAERRCRA